jgi:WD40 repeat protein
VPTGTIYHSKYREFITPMDNNIKFWNSLDGKVKRIFKNITKTTADKDSDGQKVVWENEITKCILDKNQKRIIVGDSYGDIQVFNYISGALMKKLQPHEKAEVIDIKYIETAECNIIITAGSDNII